MTGPKDFRILKYHVFHTEETGLNQKHTQLNTPQKRSAVVFALNNDNLRSIKWNFPGLIDKLIQEKLDGKGDTR